jgi:mRNA interferase MazF
MEEEVKIVKRGEIYWVDLGKGKGSEQSGVRPALIIQNDIGNEMSPKTIVASITTAPYKPYPFLVHFKAKESGLPEDSTADLASLVTISKTRLGDKCGQLPKDKMLEVNTAICVSLGIDS